MAQMIPETGQDPSLAEVHIAIKPFDSAMNRAAFLCSEPELTNYFIGTGSQPRTLEHDLKMNATTAHVMVDRVTDEILGFFTLSNQSIPRSHLPTNNLQRSQNPEISTTLLGRMAVCQKLAGKGYGKRLLMAALATAHKGATYSASAAVVVDPKKDDLVGFYAKFQFIQLKNPEKPLRMFLPMKTVAMLLSS